MSKWENRVWWLTVCVLAILMLAGVVRFGWLPCTGRGDG